MFPTFLNVRIYSSFIPAKTDVCIIIDYISFPSSGNFFGQNIILCFCHHQPTQKRQRKSKKNVFGDCIINTGSKVSRHLVSKSSGAFNFIGLFALKLYNNSHDLIMKMTQHMTSQTKRK